MPGIDWGLVDWGVIGIGMCAAGLLWHLARAYFELSKNILDILLACLLLLISWPVLLTCAVIVRLCSPGPVIFTQTRVGQDGKPFRMYKLRTMYVNAEEGRGAVWADPHDPRVIRACAWMRRSHLDELPQLINVIKGEMSLVGPRPERPEILAKLQEHYPQVYRRHAVKPGITGLAQVLNGYDTSVSAFRHKLSADLFYIENRRWSLDLAILARTLGKFHDKLAH